MELKLNKLVPKTIFDYNSQKYQLGSDNTYESNENTIGQGKFCFKCYPFLGGQFQNKMDIRIGAETIVTVSP